MKLRKMLGVLLALVLATAALASVSFAEEATEFLYNETKQREDLYLIGEQASPLFEDGVRLLYVNTITLVIGTERAAVIDTGNGWGDLIPEVRKYTDLPLILILTHRDGDHVGGAHQFEGITDIYINSLDYEGTLARQERTGNYFKATHDLQDGDIIDLGGTVLEAVSVKGHTPGSMVLWDRKNNSLYTGDAVNRRPWIFRSGIPLEEYLDDLLRLHKLTEKYQPTIYCNHSLEPYPYRVLTDSIQACAEVLLGKAEGIPYRSPMAEDGDLFEDSFEYTVGLVRLCYNINYLFSDQEAE